MKKEKEVLPLNVGPWVIGEVYCVRTPSHEFTAQLMRVYKNELVFAKANHVPESGVYRDMLSIGPGERTRKFEGEIIVGRSSIGLCHLGEL